ncbi:inhibitor of nuclear factor kappa-B kinase-interacting protein isoform X2 [Myxocyprinus asiaticus]|uniref:inhibitor of nuclear factor kappa-B kinase-interacting protein isoform X2 n=1 Tax=Myxocyprinus asiaticus TaxID=70543 RepID=UPI002223DB34|nr:inhibitor of nuclear factor kappa-B kinase-interacting protein isoform X2 [Myxocyprinus asiaticus]
MQNSEIKQRKKTLDNKDRRTEHEDWRQKVDKNSSDMKSTMLVMSLCVSVLMMWFLFQQDARLADLREKYDDLYKKSNIILDLEAQMSQVSEKLQASVDDYDGLLTADTMVTKLQQVITFIHNTTTVLQEEQEASVLHYQTINNRLRNITEVWQRKLAAVTTDLNTLKTESRSVHARITEHVNDVDARLHILTERLQEVEDGTKRNTRVLDRTEEEDAKHVQDNLDWNSRQVSKLQEQIKLLYKSGDELQKRLEKVTPRAQQWETQLPAVEESVRSMLRLRAQFSATETRLQELTLQVQRTEDEMLKTSSVVLEVKQVFNTSQEVHSHMRELPQEEAKQENRDLDSGNVDDKMDLREE